MPKLARYFEDITEFWLFKGKGLVWMSSVSRETIFELLDHPKITQLWWGYPPIIGCWGTNKFQQTKTFCIKMANFS